MSGRVDAYVAGFFIGCVSLCFMMLAVPDKDVCEVSYMKQGSKVEIVHVGVVKKY
jgi:hypothetical protein